jgi:hypothetical protein
VFTKIFRVLYVSLYFYWSPFLVFVINWALVLYGVSGIEKVKTQEGVFGWDAGDGGYEWTFYQSVNNTICDYVAPATWKWAWS